MNKLITTLLFLAGAAIAGAATCSVSLSGDDLAAVQAAVTNGASGDTICLAAGTHNWTGALNITKQVTITGPDAPVGHPTCIITGGASDGNMVNVDTTGGASGVGDHNTWTLKNIQLVYDNSGGKGSPIAIINGTARYHVNAGKPAGGGHMVNVRFSAALPNGNFTSNALKFTSGWTSGLVEHCYFDFARTSGSKAVIDIGAPAGAPGTKSSTSPYSIHGVTITPTNGLYSASVKHNWGTIGGDADPNGLGGVSEDDQWFIQNNIIEKTPIEFSITDNTNNDNSGGRAHIDHNSMWGGPSAHGFGESGACNSAAFVEAGNNYIRWPLGSWGGSGAKYGPRPTQPAFQIHNARTGAWVIYNERVQDWTQNLGVTIGASFFRFGLPGTPNMIGVADGTNFFDNNHRGHLTWTNATNDTTTYGLDPVAGTDVADTRIGSIYAKSSGPNDGSVVAGLTNNNSGLKLKSSVFHGADLGKFVGFTFRDKTRSAGANTGAQGAIGATQGSQNSGIISSSSAADANDVVTFNIMSSFQAVGDQDYCYVNTGDEWELRYIDEAIGMPGYGRLHGGLLSGDATTAAGINWSIAKNVTGATGNPVTQYWAGQDQEGIWTWNCSYRRASSGTNHNWFWAEPGIQDFTKRLAPGGIHGMTTSWPPGTTGPKPLYPKIDPTTLTTAEKDAYARIGADWDTGQFGGLDSYNNPVKVDPTTGRPWAPGAPGYPTPTAAPTPVPTPPASYVLPPASIPRDATGGIYGASQPGVSTAGASANELWGPPFPHPLASGVVIIGPSPTPTPTPTPTINSLNATTFTAGASNGYIITTKDFTGTPAFTPAPTFTPAVSNVTFTDNLDGSATLSGSASGTTGTNPHVATITAHHAGDPDATQTFNLTVNTNTPPTCSISTTATTFFESDTVQVTITSGDTDGTVSKVELYSDNVKIATITNPQASEVFNWSAASSVALTAGSHVLKAQSTDNGGQASPFSSTITLTIQTSVAQPTPPSVFLIRP